MPEDKGTAVAAVAAVGLAGVGLYLALKKPAAIRLGDSVTLTKCSFEYEGGADELWFCWGMKKGTGDFNNGDNLAGGLFAAAGPIAVGPAAAWKRYTLDPRKLPTKPTLFLDPKVLEAKTYDAYTWVATEASTDERMILAIDTDAGAVPIKEE